MLLKSPKTSNVKRGNFDYRSYLTKLSRAGSYFIVPRRYLTVFKARTAILLLHLLNVGQNRHDSESFIPATEDFVETGVGISGDAQETILNNLLRLGIIEVAKRGYPRMRHIRINLTRLEAVLSEGGMGGKAA